MATGFFLTRGGTVLELDIPAEGTLARERMDEQLGNGGLEPLSADAVEKVQVDEHTFRYRRVEQPEPIAASPVEVEQVDHPAEDVPEDGGYPGDANAADLLAWIGDDPDRAETALRMELAREVPRKGVVAALENFDA